jgi:hypothetical protein
MPFDDTQQEAFFRRWFDGTDHDYRDVMEFLHTNPRIKEVCAIPINATIVAALHQNGCALPESRVEVYQKRFELLLERWDRVRGVPGRTKVKPGDKKLFLVRLALALHSRGRRTFDLEFARKVWLSGFDRIYRSHTIDDVLDELRLVDNVVFAEGRAEFSLGHLSYQEYLAAVGIVLGQRMDVLRRKVLDTWWREVFTFYAGISGDVTKLLEIINAEYGVQCIDNVLMDEMLNEARCTPDAIRSLLVDLRQSDEWEEMDIDNDQDELGARDDGE